MSNFLSQVTQSNNSNSGIRVVIAGVEKIGKTTFTCSAPRPLLIPLEHGYMGIKVNTTPQPASFTDVISLLDEIITTAQKGKFQFKSLIFDSATALERLIHDAVLASDPAFKKGNKNALTMESALGGYGKAYQYANEKFAEFLSKCDQLATFGAINIILTCHVFAGKVIDPAFGEYDAWDLLLHSPKNNKTYGKREMLMQWADIVGFLHEPLFISKSKDSDVSMGISKNAGRILGVERIPAYAAGNRFGMKGELSVAKEQSWNYLAHAIYKSCGLDVYNRDI